MGLQGKYSIMYPSFVLITTQVDGVFYISCIEGIHCNADFDTCHRYLVCQMEPHKSNIYEGASD